MSLTEIKNQLGRIEQLLERLVVPLVAEEARQLASASPEQIKEHNRGVIARAKLKGLSCKSC